jgi:nucleoside-diphosphate-sugar epimerase
MKYLENIHYKKTALVLGAGGFIGVHMVRRLKKEGYWVRGRNSNNNLIYKKLKWNYSMPLKEGILRTYDWINLQLKLV